MVHSRLEKWTDVAYSGVLAGGLTAAVVHWMLGLYHLAFIALALVAMGATALAFERIPTLAWAWRPALRRASRTVPVGRQLWLEAVQVRGCAWGYRPGDHWAIGSQGGIAPQLCRTAANAVETAVHTEGAPGKARIEVVCPCPLGRQAVFALRPA